MIAVGAEKADYSLGLLKGLNEAVEQDAVKAAIAKPNAILMMLLTRRRSWLTPVWSDTRSIASERSLRVLLLLLILHGYQGEALASSFCVVLAPSTNQGCVPTRGWNCRWVCGCWSGGSMKPVAARFCWPALL